MGPLEGKTAVVTGGGAGIGRGIARLLAARGATVVVTDVDEGRAAATAAEIGPPALGLRADVASLASVQQMVADVAARLGRIDVLVNNAGWDKAAPFLDLDPALWDPIIKINLFGTIHTLYAVLPGMVAQGGGRIVNVASDAGRVGSSGEAVYSAAKGGVIAFTKTMAREMARQNVTINCVCPGPTDTALFAEFAGDNDRLRAALTKAIPLGRLGQPGDVAAAVAFLASDEAAFITGQTVSVSGGLTMS